MNLSGFAAQCTDPTILPYWPVWAAAQFASTDAGKPAIMPVHVWQDGDFIQIESTDGFRAFRYRLPAHGPYRVNHGEVLIDAKALKKPVSKACVLSVSDKSTRATFYDRSFNELSSVALSRDFVMKSGHNYVYPKLNQLYPTEFTNSGDPFAFGASLLKTICTVAEKLSVNGNLKVQCNKPNLPYVLTTAYDDPFINSDYSVLEFLLMPVLIKH